MLLSQDAFSWRQFKGFSSRLLDVFITRDLQSVLLDKKLLVLVIKLSSKFETEKSTIKLVTFKELEQEIVWFHAERSWGHQLT